MRLQGVSRNALADESRKGILAMITVVILAFNEEKLLRKTADTMMQAASLAGQVPLDIIVINDGSTDRTPEIIRELEAEHPFIRSIQHAQNKGPGVGVKQAIAIAKYPRFIVTPGDNDLSLDVMTQLFLNRDKADLVLAYYTNMKERGWFRCGLSGLYTSIYQRTFNISLHYVNSPCLYLTEQLRCLDFRSNRLAYQAEFAVKILCSGGSFYQIAGLRQNEQSPSRALSLKNLREAIDVFLNLVYEVKITDRKKFNRKPVEIF